MRHAAALLALLATACSTMEPKYARPDPAIPRSWPVGDPYLVQSEVGLPVLTYSQVFQDPRLQRLIAQALTNNRDLMVAAANISGAREQYRIQRAQQLPTVNGQAGVNLSGDKEKTVSAQYQAGVSVPNFELDLFGRLRSLSHVELQRYFASEAGARATRLTLVANIAIAWLNHAADSSLLRIAQDTAASAGKSVELTRLRLEGGIAPRTDLRQA
jgi:multidrug efflux system outer membrane protein